MLNRQVVLACRAYAFHAPRVLASPFQSCRAAPLHSLPRPAQPNPSQPVLPRRALPLLTMRFPALPKTEFGRLDQNQHSNHYAPTLIAWLPLYARRRIRATLKSYPSIRRSNRHTSLDQSPLGQG